MFKTGPPAGSLWKASGSNLRIPTRKNSKGAADSQEVTHDKHANEHEIVRQQGHPRHYHGLFGVAEAEEAENARHHQVSDGTPITRVLSLNAVRSRLLKACCRNSGRVS